MPKYDLLYDIAFSVISDTPDGSDVTAGDIRRAILGRLADLDSNEIHEAVSLVDSIETEE
jgi:hypothetical protein